MKNKALAVVVTIMFCLALPFSARGQRGSETAPPEGSGERSRRTPPGRFEPVPPGPPDLSIRQLSVSPATPFLGEPLRLEAQVFNAGSVGLDGIVVQFFIGDYPVGEAAIAFLPGNASGSSQVTVAAGPGGRQSVRAVVDPGNGIAESNERNNEARRQITIRPRPGPTTAGERRDHEERPERGPEEEPEGEPPPGWSAPPPDDERVTDLLVEEFPLTEERVPAGETVRIEARVVNAGAIRADRVGVRFMVEGQQIGADRFVTLWPRAGQAVSASWTPQHTGHYALFVVVDPDGKIHDPHRENNIREAVIEVVPGSGPERDLVGDAPERTLDEVEPAALQDDQIDTSKGLTKIPVLKVPPTGSYLGTGDSIVVTSPLKSSTWPQGSPQQISWAVVSGKAGPAFTIELRQGGAAVATVVANKTFSANLHPWTVPAALADGTYRIRVADAADPTVQGTSALFQVGQAPPMIVVEKVLDLASITVTSPAAGDLWTSEGPKLITWKKQGTMNAKVRIEVVRPGSTPSLVASPVAAAAPNTGSFDWKAGWASVMPCGEGPYVVRVTTVDGAVSGDSGVFTLGSAAAGLKISKPATGEIWTPLKSYTVGWILNGGVCDEKVDIRLIPQVTVKLGEKTETIFEPQLATWVVKGYTPTGTPPSYLFKVPGYLPTGAYKLLVESRDGALLQDSRVLSVKAGYEVPGGTGFLAPDQPDLVALGFFQTAPDKMALRVKNVGASYDGKVRLSHVLGVTPTWAKPGGGSALSVDEEIYFPIKANETKDVKNFGVSTATDSYHLPTQVPESIRASVFPVDATDAAPGNNYIQDYLCLTEGPDIAVRNYLSLALDGKQNWLQLTKGSSKKINHADLQWVSAGEFEVTLAARLFNYGCEDRLAECAVYVDQQPAQALGKHYVRTGESVLIEKKIRIKVADLTKSHQLVFIADQDEMQNQGYPNSYLNNFVNVYFTIVKTGGTVTGTFDP